MPRSYSFDHFQVPAAEPRSRSLRRQDKQTYSGSRQEAQEEELEQGVHYGRSHAETEALFHAHASEREPLTAGEAKHAGTKFAHARPATESVQEAVQARQAEAPPTPRSTLPIGSLPGAEEVLPQGRMQDLLDEASRQMQVLQAGVGDVTRAASRLASLPLEAVRLAARRLRLVHG